MMPLSYLSHKATISVICIGFVFSSHAAAAVVPVSSSLEVNTRVSVPHDQPGDVDQDIDSQGATVLNLAAQTASSMSTPDGTGNISAIATATWNGPQEGLVEYEQPEDRTTDPNNVGVGAGYEWNYTFQADTATILTFTAWWEWFQNGTGAGGGFETYYTINGNRQFATGTTSIQLPPGVHTFGFDSAYWSTSVFWDAPPAPPVLGQNVTRRIEWELVPEPSTVTLLMLVNLTLVGRRCRGQTG